MESALTISPSKAWARATLIEVFPEAVGPAMMMHLGRFMVQEFKVEELKVKEVKS